MHRDRTARVIDPDAVEEGDAVYDERSRDASDDHALRENDRRVLIFAENREGTKRYLKRILEQAIEGTDRAEERIEVIDGLTSSARPP